MDNDDSTLDLVEREIQRAEELLARDLTVIKDVDTNWTPSKGRRMPQNPRLPETRRKELIANLRAGRNEDGSGEAGSDGRGPQLVSGKDAKLESFIIRGGTSKKGSSTHKAGKTTPDDSNRYKDRTSRDALINKLLTEHKSKKDGGVTSGTGAMNESLVMQSTPKTVDKSLAQTYRPQNVKPETPSSIHIKRTGSVVIDFDKPTAVGSNYSRNSIRNPQQQEAIHQSGMKPGSSSSSATRNPTSYNNNRRGIMRDGQSLRKSSLETSHSNNKKYNDSNIAINASRRVTLNDQNKTYSKNNNLKAEKQRALGRSLRKSNNDNINDNNNKKTYGNSSFNPTSRANMASGTSKWASRSSRPFSRKTKEDVKRELDKKLKEECTFRPKINPMPSTSKLANETREQRLKRLAEDKSAKIARREQNRVAKEQANVKKNCTFKPKTNKVFVTRRDGKVDWSSVEDAERSRVPLQDRLHHEADERAAMREKMKRDLEAQEMSSYPFKPSINPRSNAILNMNAYKPIHERIEDLQKAKLTGLHKRRLQTQKNNPDLTFQPKISKQSRQLVASRRRENADDVDASNVTKRLVMDAEEKIDRAMTRRKAWEAEQRKIYTFQPRVNDTSRAIVANSGADDKSFLKRQDMLAERAAAREKRLKKKAMLENECTFKPEIGNATAVLQHTRPQRLKESELERVERLSRQDQLRVEKRRQAAQEQYYKQFSHQPIINEISSNLARSKTVDEMASNKFAKKRMDERIRKRDEELKQQCPFEPTFVETRIASNYRDKVSENKGRATVLDPDTIIEKIERSRERKQMKIEEITHQNQYDEYKMCTFQPSINRSRPKKGNGPVVVKGFGRFLELKELAKKIEEEKSAREDRAFMVENSRYRSGNRTVPKPFKLSGKGRAKRRKELEAKIRAEELKECTFNPKTTEARNRKLISELLADEDSEIEFEI